MPESKRLALIDLGSNALRFAIIERQDGVDRCLYHHRAPIRLGSEVFATGEISLDKIAAVAQACAQFAERCRQHRVAEVFGIATSAAREASNSQVLVDAIARHSGIVVEVISGEEECRLLTLAIGLVMDLSQDTSLLVDLGGGSIEVSLISAGRVTSSQSHPLGVLRFDHDQSLRGDDLIAAINQQLHQRGTILCQQLHGARIERYIAVGGHMDALVELLTERARSQQQAGISTIQTTDLHSLLVEMSPYDPSQLTSRYQLRPDRSDSIIAAAIAYLWIAAKISAELIWAPKVSLRQGMMAAKLGEN